MNCSGAHFDRAWSEAAWMFSLDTSCSISTVVPDLQLQYVQLWFKYSYHHRFFFSKPPANLFIYIVPLSTAGQTLSNGLTLLSESQLKWMCGILNSVHEWLLQNYAYFIWGVKWWHGTFIKDKLRYCLIGDSQSRELINSFNLDSWQLSSYSPLYPNNRPVQYMLKVKEMVKKNPNVAKMLQQITLWSEHLTKLVP